MLTIGACPWLHFRFKPRLVAIRAGSNQAETDYHLGEVTVERFAVA